MRQYYLLSGLPRSGSTMLTALLQQNPRFHAEIHSPFATCVAALIDTMRIGTPEVTWRMSDEAKIRSIRGALDAYFADIPEDKAVFLSSRALLSYHATLRMVIPGFKVVSMVRNPAWIADSFERAINKSPFVHSTFVSTTARTQEERISEMMTTKSILGRALNYTRQMYFGEFSEDMMLIDYDAFCAAPDKGMSGIYSFIGEEPFEHDFFDFELQDHELDKILGSPGMHSVKGPIFQHSGATVLPAPIFDKLSQQVFWHAQGSSRSARLVAMRKPPEPMPKDDAAKGTASTEEAKAENADETESGTNENATAETKDNIRLF